VLTRAGPWYFWSKLSHKCSEYYDTFLYTWSHQAHQGGGLPVVAWAGAAKELLKKYKGAQPSMIHFKALAQGIKRYAKPGMKLPFRWSCHSVQP
jgi:hypothetical protein